DADDLVSFFKSVGRADKLLICSTIEPPQGTLHESKKIFPWFCFAHPGLQDRRNQLCTGERSSCYKAKFSSADAFAFYDGNLCVFHEVSLVVCYCCGEATLQNHLYRG